jgi:signal transduction histidine kinase
METKKLLTFSATSDIDFVTVMVKDSGIGLKKEHLAHLFEEFFKADPARHSHSAGLGLSICKRIIEKHGGKIWAESAGIGKGVAFYFTIPIYTGQVQKKEEEKK